VFHFDICARSAPEVAVSSTVGKSPVTLSPLPMLILDACTTERFGETSRSRTNEISFVVMQFRREHCCKRFEQMHLGGVEWQYSE